MTQAILTAHNYSTKAIEVVIEVFRSFREARKEQRMIKATEKELGRLSDYDLADIGLTRGDIYTVARCKSTIENARTNNNLRGWV
jgi:uncharacterized protein YjiS (DUF1127 family)